MWVCVCAGGYNFCLKWQAACVSDHIMYTHIAQADGIRELLLRRIEDRAVFFWFVCLVFG